MNDEVRRKFLSDYPEQDPNPTLQDILHDDEPPFIPRTEAENQVFASLPGDDLSMHPLGPHTDDPYLGRPIKDLKALLEDESLDGRQKLQVAKVLKQYHEY